MDFFPIFARKLWNRLRLLNERVKPMTPQQENACGVPFCCLSCIRVELRLLTQQNSVCTSSCHHATACMRKFSTSAVRTCNYVTNSESKKERDNPGDNQTPGCTVRMQYMQRLHSRLLAESSVDYHTNGFTNEFHKETCQ